MHSTHWQLNTTNQGHLQPLCYRLSKRPNYSRGTCSGLGTWRPRCTEDASSGTRHIIPFPLLSPIACVTVLLNGGASPMMPASSMTHVSAPALVLFPQLSPHVCSYCPIIPSPCALGQQVIVCYRSLLFPLASYPYRPDHS